MRRDQTYGLLVAATLGVATGIAIAPVRTRAEAGRRLARFVEPLIDAMARDFRAAQSAAQRLAEDTGAAAVGAFDTVRRQLVVRRTQTHRLKKALQADSLLAQREIWVDAVGNTILLHGVVDDDEEWRRADLLARSMSPDGSVRNLLQVRRAAADTET